MQGNPLWGIHWNQGEPINQIKKINQVTWFYKLPYDVTIIEFICGIYPNIRGLLITYVKEIPQYVPSNIIDIFLNINEVDNLKLGLMVETKLLKFNNLIVSYAVTINAHTE